MIVLLLLLPLMMMMMLLNEKRKFFTFYTLRYYTKLHHTMLLNVALGDVRVGAQQTVWRVDVCVGRMLFITRPFVSTLSSTFASTRNILWHF